MTPQEIQRQLDQLDRLHATILADSKRVKRVGEYDRFVSLTNQMTGIRDHLIRNTGMVPYWTINGFALRSAEEEEGEDE